MDANFSQFFSNLIKKIKTRKFCVSAVALLLLLTMMASVLAGVNANFKYMAQQNAPYLEEANLAYKSTTAVGYSSSILGTVEREIPTETKNSGLADSDGILNGIGYPVYNRQLSAVRGADDAKKKMRRALITEANYLAAVGTANAKGGAGDYLWMDKNGYLYNGTTTNPIPAMEKDIKGFFNDPTKGNEGDEGVSISSVETTSVHRQLYKHTSSVGLYGGNIADNEPAVIKQITMRYRGYSGYGVTGLYAPAGEVVKVTIPAQYMNATGGLTFHIGQALFNGQANNIWVAKNEMNRMPVILNTLTLNKDRTFYDAETNTYTGYIGSFLGGPVYIRNNSATYTVTISGAVEYNHFILGYTTEEDFKRTSQTSAPYFDLEVQSYGVLHSGPKSNASSYSYSQIYDVAVLWEKVSTATTLGSNNNIGVVFIYDPFVAAGAAVAFPGRMSVNCPSGWMRDALNYNGIINSGSWGNFHEYHHNFQGFGVGDGGEVTNNAMTLASYALYTKISANRGINSYGAAGLSGWNCYTSATWALDQTLRISRPNVSPGDGDKGLALYATLLHNFGVEAFYNARKQASGQSYLGYMNGWQKATHNDMTYFFKYILNAVGEQGNKITEEQLNEFKNTNYPLFVPVSCVYQTGRTYRYDNKYISATTMQPYVINYGENFTLDLRQYTVNGNMYTSGSIVLPDEFEFSVKNTPTCEYGRIVKTNTAGVYTYIPDPNHMNSGKINVTLQLRAKSGAFANDEYFKNRKIEDVHLTLSFDQTHETTKNMLKRTTYTYAPNSAPTSAVTAFNTNYAGYASKVEGNNVNRTQNCNTDIWYTNQEGDEVPLNSAVELKGKIYVGETAKYRISIRGRWNVALFISLDGGKNYKLAGAYTQTNTSSYTFPKDANGKDLVGTYSDYELQAGSWVYFKAVMITGQNGKMASFIGVGWGKFTPEQGTINEETGEIDNYSPESINVTYATANRDTYQPNTKTFKTDYLYTRSYSYSYSNSYDIKSNNFPNVSVVSNTGVGTQDNYSIKNIFDNNPDTFAHTAAYPTSTKPWEFTIDLGKQITVNRFVLTGRTLGNQNQTANSITLWVGNSPNKLEEVISFNDGKVENSTLQFNFSTKTFRYFKLQIRKTVQGGYCVIKNINFTYNRTNGKQYSLDSNNFTMLGKWDSKQTFSSFGHTYIGYGKSSVKFTFTGTSFAILSPQNLPTNFTVFIDGKKYNSINFVDKGGYAKLTYLSEELENKQHNIIIVCNNESNIDSVVLF